MPGLEDLYREIILDHYKNPRNRGELETPPATVAEGHNPLCGDEITVYVLIDDGRVSEVRTAGQGCSISQSSASMMTQAVKGRTLDEARGVIHRFKHMMSIEDHHHDDHQAEHHRKEHRHDEHRATIVLLAPTLLHVLHVETGHGVLTDLTRHERASLAFTRIALPVTGSGMPSLFWSTGGRSRMRDPSSGVTPLVQVMSWN